MTNQPETDETDEQRADREATEADHARGDHTYCGITCEVEMPTEHLRNFVIAKGYPGTKGALDELLRRARAEGAVSAAVAPPTDDTETAEPREPDNPAAWALAQHIADHPVSTVQAAFRYLNAPLTLELREEPAAVAPPTQAALRDRIAEALMQWAESNNSPQYGAMRRPETVVQNAYSRDGASLHARAEELDTQLAALRQQVTKPADRAAVLADAESAIRTATRSCGYKAEDGCDFCNGVAAALDQVRRMADETATQTPEEQ